MNEVAIRCGRPLRSVVLTNPALPLPTPPPPPAPVAPVGPSTAELHQRDRQAIEAALHQLRQAAGDLASASKLMREQMQKAAVEMAVAIAAHLLHERIEANDFAVEALVERVMAPLPPGPSVSIHLHPEDVKLLQQRLGDSAPLSSTRPDLQVVADPALSRGSCRAHTEGLDVLADMGSQLADLRRHLLGSVGDAEAKPSSPAV